MARARTSQSAASATQHNGSATQHTQTSEALPTGLIVYIDMSQACEVPQNDKRLIASVIGLALCSCIGSFVLVLGVVVALHHL